MNKIKIENFIGKVISFSSNQESLALKVEEIRNYEDDRIFICGKITRETTRNDWASGKTGCIRWSEITDFIEFESEEEYIKAMKISNS